MRARKGVSAAFSGWTQRPGIKLTGFPFTERSLDCLNVAWASRLQEFPLNAQSSELRRGFWANAAQAVQRKPWGGPGTLTANGVWYSFEADCCLDGIDTLRVQGAPSAMSTGQLTVANLKELAGEPFFLGSVGSVVVALYASPYASWLRDV